MANDKTEKATPKKRDEARKKGQVARSMDLNGAVVLLAALLALSAFAPEMCRACREATRDLLALDQPARHRRPRERSRRSSASSARRGCCSLAPIAAVCLVAGVLVSVAPGRLQALARRRSSRTRRSSTRSQGAKQIFGTHALFESGKSIVKIVAVGAIALLALLPKLEEMAALVGMPPAVLLPEIGQRGARRSPAAPRSPTSSSRSSTSSTSAGATRSSCKMDKQEVKDEYKQQSLPSRGQVDAAPARDASWPARA